MILPDTYLGMLSLVMCLGGSMKVVAYGRIGAAAIIVIAVVLIFLTKGTI